MCPLDQETQRALEALAREFGASSPAPAEDVFWDQQPLRLGFAPGEQVERFVVESRIPRPLAEFTRAMQTRLEVQRAWTEQGRARLREACVTGRELVARERARLHALEDQARAADPSTRH